ncbi:hypothetical protein BC567DRAFT_223947 [Phyllosticta citribraziliensis]
MSNPSSPVVAQSSSAAPFTLGVFSPLPAVNWPATPSNEPSPASGLPSAEPFWEASACMFSTISG